MLEWAVCSLPHADSLSLSPRILQPRAKKSSRPPSTCRSLHPPSRCDNNSHSAAQHRIVVQLLLCARLSHARLRSLPPYPLLDYTSSRADHIAYCNTRYLAYRNPPSHSLPTPQHILEATIATASFVRQLFFCLFLDTVYHIPLTQTVSLFMRTKLARPLRLCYSAFLAGLPTDRTPRPSFSYPTTLALPIYSVTHLGIPSPRTFICRSDKHSLIH